MSRMLDSDEAARRLGVKVTTLYAYVSRGLLVSHPSGAGRRSLFDVEEIERLARRSRQGKAVETRMATVTTGITQLGDDGPVYRGRRAVDLATGSSFEEVADWLWSSGADADPVEADGGGPRGRPEDWSPLALGPPPDVGRSDRMRWAVLMAGAHDPLRSDLRPGSVRRNARRVAASMVASLAPAVPRTSGAPTAPIRLVLDDGSNRSDSLAAQLTVALSPEPSDALVRGVNAALVLMADHELATSTMAVRLAASTRADLCDALLAGLATLAGPLHGGASQLAFALLADAERDGIERALNDTLRYQRILPGFGHTVYRQGDARFTVLLGLFEQLASPEHVRLVTTLIEMAEAHAIPPPNVDLALAAMAWATDMPADTGWCLFAVARVAGWVAHYLEELEERPLRYRARAVYVTATDGRATTAGPTIRP